MVPGVKGLLCTMRVVPSCVHMMATVRCICEFRHFFLLFCVFLFLDPVSDFSVLLGVQRRDDQPLELALVAALVVADHDLRLLTTRGHV